MMNEKCFTFKQQGTKNNRSGMMTERCKQQETREKTISWGIMTERFSPSKQQQIIILWTTTLPNYS